MIFTSNNPEPASVVDSSGFFFHGYSLIKVQVHKSVHGYNLLKVQVHESVYGYNLLKVQVHKSVPPWIQSS